MYDRWNKVADWLLSCRCLSLNAASTDSATCRDRSAPNWRRRCDWPRLRWKSGSRIDATRRSGSWCWLPSNSIIIIISRWRRRWRVRVVEWPSKFSRRTTPAPSCADHLRRRLRGTVMPPSPPQPPPQTSSARYKRSRRLPLPPVLTVPSCPEHFLFLFQLHQHLQPQSVASEYEMHNMHARYVWVDC